MSYILEALKKAESERGPSATSMPPALRDPAHLRRHSAPPSRLPVVFAALALLAIGLAALVWSALPQKSSTYTVTVTTSPPDPAVRSPLSTPAIMSAIPAPRAQQPAPAARIASAPMPAIASAHATSKIEERLPELHELPEALQRDIPALSVSGYIYAEQPADRSIIINRKFLREGDQVAADLLLEKLTPGGMILNFRGVRYRATY